MSNEIQTESKKPKTYGTKRCGENLLAKGAFCAVTKTDNRRCGAYLKRDGECPNKWHHHNSVA
jgi:hypothetical protein